MDLSTAVFSIFAALLVWVSFGSLRSGFRYHKLFARGTAGTRPERLPFVSVIVPCRGKESGLEANLEALFSQDYPLYEVVFVTSDEADASLEVVRGFLGRPNVKLVFAGHAEDESQKVANLRAGVAAAAPESVAFVFMDSDARPSERWLASLVEALLKDGVGVSTGYRWFISLNRGLASELLACWNASVASRLGEDGTKNFCWGGSTAILRTRFDELRIAERWNGVLSDDYAVMRAVREAGYSVVFVPQAMCASIQDCTFGELIEFTTRQMKITRVYAPALWISGLVGSFLFNWVVIWGTVLVLVSSGLGRWIAAFSLSLVWGFSVGKAFIRLRAVELGLPGFASQLRQQTASQLVLWAATPALFLYNCVAALLSRDIVWRGIKYRLVSPTETARRR